MREEDRKLAWGAVLVLAIVAVELGVLLLVGPANQGADHNTNQSAYEWIWDTVLSAAFWTALFTGALTASTYFLWRETRRLAEGADDQARKMEASIHEMRRTADAGAEAIAVTREMGRAQSRAYLVVKDAFMYARSNYRDMLTLKIENVGTTPAKWLEIESSAHLVGKSTDAEQARREGGGKISRWPCDPREQEFPADPDCGAVTLEELLRIGIKDQTFIVFQGCIRWETVFGEVYESDFFFWRAAYPVTLVTENGGYVEKPIVMARPALPLDTYRFIRLSGA